MLCRRSFGLFPRLHTITLFKLSRTFHRRLSPLAESHSKPSQSQNWVSRLMLQHLNQDAKHQCDLLLDREFYDNLQKPKSLKNIIEWKVEITAAFYFRDYPMLQMSLDNEAKLIKDANAQVIFIRKLLMNILSDHQALKSVVGLSSKSSIRSFLSVYIRSLAQLVLGEFSEAEHAMLRILNDPLVQMGVEPESSCILVDKSEPASLNIKQQVLFNYLICRMYRNAETPPPQQCKGIELYAQIKAGKNLLPQHFNLEDYEQFLNVWISAKHDRPMEWVDLSMRNKGPYFRYLYMLAENYYIKKELHKSHAILSQLPREYPLRQFLQLSELYDQQKYQQLIQRFDQIHQKAEKGDGRYHKMPEFDSVILNMMKVVEKAEAKLAAKEGTHAVSDMQESIALMKYNANIRNIEGGGIPYYYLNIPFRDLLLRPEIEQIER